jgi:hypothetical protein
MTTDQDYQEVTINPVVATDIHLEAMNHHLEAMDNHLEAMDNHQTDSMDRV